MGFQTSPIDSSGAKRAVSNIDAGQAHRAPRVGATVEDVPSEQALARKPSRAPAPVAAGGLSLPNRDNTGVHPLRMVDPPVFDAHNRTAISDFFFEQGYAVVDGVSHPTEREAVVALMDRTVQQPGARRLGFMDVYHDDALAQLRQNPTLYGVFAHIFRTERLWSVFDRVMYWQAAEGELPLPPHVDQNPLLDPGFGHVQAMLALRPMNEGSGTLALAPRSSQFFDTYARWTPPGAGFIEYQGTEPLDFIGLRLAPGQIVLWDSRTTHSRFRGTPNADRYAALITYKPAVDDDALVSARLACFDAGTGANHHAAGLRATAPPRWALSARQTQEQLTPLGRQLYGLTSWFSDAHVLLNAEPFGFGPAAAVAQLAESLRGKVASLGYIGSGHTLQLQHPSLYDEVVEVPSQEPHALRDALGRLRGSYTHFLTACDFETVPVARAAGYEVGIYDPLTWFWPTLPGAIASAQLYVAQDFFGVAERMAEQPAMFPAATHVVPLLVDSEPRVPIADRTSGALVNIGGLSNPITSDDVLSRFASLVATGCREAASDLDLTCVGNRRLLGVPTSDMLAQPKPKNVHAHLRRSRLAFMTSGLGNLTEASAAGTPTVWLPPANDSQGQQVALLQRHGLIDGCVDWKDFTDGPAIDYFAPQAQVMAAIEQKMTDLVDTPATRERFVAVLKERARTVRGHQATSPRLNGWADQMGQGGVQALAEIVQSWASASKRST